MTLLVSAVVINYAGVITAIFNDRNAQTNNKRILGFALVAAALHSWYSVASSLSATGFDFSFFSASNLISLALVIMALLMCLRQPLLKLITPFFVLAIINVLASHFAETSPTTLPHYIAAHVIPSLLAYSVLTISACHAMLLWFQHRALKSHKLDRLIQTLPSLDVLESSLFTIVWFGFLLLTVSIATGAIYVEDFWGQKLAHKSVFTILAWITFAALLIGRHFANWRGVKAVNWTVGGFILLLLGYFGSKFVLEYLL